MEHRDAPFPCRVVRHRGARRMTLRVCASGVRLTVPPRTPAARVDAFLRDSEPWVAAQRTRLPPAPPPLADGDVLARLDERLRLMAVPRGRGPAVRRGGLLEVPGDPPGPRVERWYRGEALAETDTRARALAATLGVRVAGVAIRDPRSRWGSCASTGRLSFSWRLMLAPGHVLDHVVAHEVCHLAHADHSPAFWDLLARVSPGHEAARAWLRAHGHLLHRGPAWPALAAAEGISPA